MQFTTGAWARVTSSPIVGLEYSDGQRYYVHTAPLTFLDDIEWNGSSGTNPNEIGNRFVFPFRSECIGVCYRGGDPAQSWEMAMYDSADNFLGYREWDSDFQVNGNQGANAVSDQHILWPATGSSTPPAGVVTLEPYTMYRIVCHPKDGTMLSRRIETEVNEAASMQAQLGGIEFYKTAREIFAPTAWTDTPTRRVGIYPILSAIDTGFAMPIAPPVGAQ
jgi:hypothetical protein